MIPAREAQRKSGPFPVPAGEWDLPAAYSAEGGFLSLRDLADGAIAVAREKLSPERLQRLVAARIGGGTPIAADGRAGWRESTVELELIALDFICEAAGIPPPAAGPCAS